jgi:hypothetical protein
MKIKINETTAAILSKYKNIFFKVIKEKENLYLDFIDTVMIKSNMFKDSSGTEILSIKKFVYILDYVGHHLYRIKKTVLVNSVNYKDVFISVIKVKDLYIQIIDNSNKTLSLSPFFIFNKETNTCLIFRDNYNAGLMKHFLLQHEGSKGLESNINIIYI